MGRLADIDAEMHELPDSVKEAQETLDSTKNMRAYVLGFELGQEAERERIIKLLEEEMERIRSMDGYPATNALANIRAALIKGENTDKAIVHTSTDNAITDTQGENK